MKDESKMMQSSQQNWTTVVSTKNLSVVVTGAVLMVALLKAERKDIPEIVSIMFGSNTFAVVGWSLAVTFLVCGVLFCMVLSRVHRAEIERLAKERDRLQSNQLTKAK